MALSGKQFDEWSEALDQIVEMMNGIRSRLEAEGYSPTAAEQVAVALLQSNTRGGGTDG